MPPYIQKASGRGQARFANPTQTGSNVLAVIGCPFRTSVTPAWDSTTTYRKDSLVLYSAVVYTSLQEFNLNNQPDISPAQWATLSAWNAGSTYAVNNIVTHSGLWWSSLQDGNIGNTPVGPPTDLWWTQVGPTGFLSNLFIGVNNFGSNQIGDDKGNYYNGGVVLSDSTGPNDVQSDVWSIVTASIPGTNYPPNSGVQSVYMCPLASDQYLWIYELDSSAVQNAIDQDNGTDVEDAESGHDSSPSSFNGGAVGHTYNPPPTVGDFVVAIFGLESGSITAGPDSSWTADTPQGPFGVYYKYAFNGEIPVPTTTASGVVFWEMSLMGMVSAPPLTTGNIVIQKATSPGGSPQSFTFTPSYGAPFTLTDGQSNDSGPLAPGTYSVVETPVTGWLTTTSSDPSNIVVTAGNTTTVTFTNTISNIVIRKATVPTGSSQVFTFTPSYGAPFTLIDGGSNDSGPLAPGTYSVVETPVVGWTTATSSDPSAIVVTAGNTTTVTFTNTAPGTIIVRKATVPSGSSQLFSFTSSYGSPFFLTDGQSNNSGPLLAGTYSVSEAPVIGWTTTVSQDPTAIVITPGLTVTVTFTNTATPGRIITTKIMAPPSAQRFTFNPSWGTAFILGNGESNDSGPLAAGTYNISESPVDGWITTATPNPANLTVADGQTTTVTFTNTSSISGPPPNCDTPISALAENVLNRLEEKFNVS